MSDEQSIPLAMSCHLNAAEKKAAFKRHKLEKKLARLTGSAIVDFNMIEDGDTVMVGVSGGKDSYALLALLSYLQKRAPVSFKLLAVHVDSGFPEHDPSPIINFLESHKIDYHIEKQDIFSILEDKIPQNHSKCALCGRLRRGILYRLAKERKITKIALGHHLDDSIETFFLNLFHTGRIKSMPPKLKTDDQHHILIRPLAYCREKDIAMYAKNENFPIVENTYCAKFDRYERENIKTLLRMWERQHPGRMASITHALSDVTPSHLYDRTLFDFVNLRISPEKPENN